MVSDRDKHHPSCKPGDQELVWHCAQCGTNEPAALLADERDAALAHLRATAGLLLYTERKFRPSGHYKGYNFVVVTRCKGDSSQCQYTHYRADDGRERVVEGHSEDCPLGWLEALG